MRLRLCGGWGRKPSSQGPRGESPGRQARKQSCISGRPLVWSCGVRATVVVLANRIGCRSRQAARGHLHPCAKSAWTTKDGLASRCESTAEVKERRKPARPWQSGEYGGGLSTKSEMAGANSAHQGAPVDGRRLGPTKSFVLTGGRWKRSSVFGDSGNRAWRGRQGTSKVGRAASSEKTTLP